MFYTLEMGFLFFLENFAACNFLKIIFALNISFYTSFKLNDKSVRLRRNCFNFPRDIFWSYTTKIKITFKMNPNSV